MNRRLGTCVGAAAILVAAGAATADVSLQIFSISSQVGGGDWETKTFLRPVDQIPNPIADAWDIPGSAFANGAEFEGARVEIIYDPVVTLNFNASAGSTNTNFAINSALLSFSTIGSLQAVASAAVTITDSGLFPDGQVNFAGGFGGKAYEARINNNTFNFASLLNSFSQGVFGGPSLGTLPVYGDSTGVLSPVIGLGTATSISSHFSFSLSPRDRVSGTSTFEIIPAPGAGLIGLMGAGLLAARRRR